MQQYGPELEKRCPLGSQRRLTEGNPFLAAAKRDAQAAKRFLRKALNAVYTQAPSVINVDKNAAYPKAINELKEKEELLEQVELRQNKYLNNIVELSASGDKAISQAWDGIRFIQHGKANDKGLRSYEHDAERTN